MALGTKDLLSLSVEHDNDRSLPLNMLVCPLGVVCSGWWTLSKIVSNLLRVLLSATVVRQSCIPLLYAASPAHHSIKKDAGNNRLIEHAQEFAADIEGPQPPQEVEPALTLFVDCINVG